MSTVVSALSPSGGLYMPDMIRDGKICPDQWTFVPKQPVDDMPLPQGAILMHVNAALALQDVLAERNDVGLWFDADDDVTQLTLDVNRYPVIGVYFPDFMDGRGFSTGRLLRDRLHYRGELRAIGHFVRDQLFYLKRCGFNAFCFAEEENLTAAIQSLHDLSETYQAAADQPLPLFQR